MLELDPTTRITCTDALSHFYFQQLHDIEDEPVAPSLFEDDLDKDYSKEKLKEQLLQEIRIFYPDYTVTMN